MPLIFVEDKTNPALVQALLTRYLFISHKKFFSSDFTELEVKFSSNFRSKFYHFSYTGTVHLML